MDDSQFEYPEAKDAGHFEDMMFQLAVFLGAVQEEISKTLIQNEKIRADTENVMKRPDHEITGVLDREASRFILAMPVASAYGVNLLMNVIEHHSSITGNKAITEVCEKVRAKINSCNHN